MKESGSSDGALSRIPLAPLIFLGTVVGIGLLAITTLGFYAILAAVNPPLVHGNPISIAGLHRQLTSPVEVLSSAFGDAPLAMNIQFHGQDEGQVRFGGFSRSTSPEEREKSMVLDEQSSQRSSPTTPYQTFRAESILDDMSQEESRVLIGMQQRQVARQQQAGEPPVIRSSYYSEIPSIYYANGT